MCLKIGVGDGASVLGEAIQAIGGELVTFLQGVGVGAVDREEGGVGVLVTIVEMMEERLKDLGRSLVSILSLSL